MVALGRKHGPAERQLMFRFSVAAAKDWTYVFGVATATALRMGLSEDDGHDAALHGLLRAVDRYDANRKAKLTTLATAQARYYLLDALRGRGRSDAMDHAVTAGSGVEAAAGVWLDRPLYADEAA